MDADLYKFDLVRCSFIPPKDFRQLRELSMIPFQAGLHEVFREESHPELYDHFQCRHCQCALWPFRQNSNWNHVLSAGAYCWFHGWKAVRKLIKKGAKAKSDEIIEAIKGYNIETDQAKKLELAQGHLEYLDDMITQTEVELYVRIKPYYEFVEFVSTMPGMTELSSTIVLAETGVDMDIFDDAKHLCSWCGLSPANNESAGKKKSVRIAKAGDYLKPMMVQCALAAIKSKKQPYFAIKYGRIKKRRGHKKAIIAIARMMMVCIYHMVSEKKPFTPTDYEELMDPQNHVESVVLNENNVFAYLESLGYDSSKLVKRNDN